MLPKEKYNTFSSEVLIIGGGFAGMYAALAARKKGAQVTILCKSKTGGSGNSVVSMSVHRFAPKNPEEKEAYRKRFFESSAGIQDPELADFFVENAAEAMKYLREYNLPLQYRSLEEKGEDYEYFACCNPKKGYHLTKTLRELLEQDSGVQLIDNITVCDIIHENKKAVGVIALNQNRYEIYTASSIILACGGAGTVYAATSNTSDLTGDGYCMAGRCGLPLKDMEFIQFYPYRIYSPRQADIFPDIFEHGAVFRNTEGEQFMDRPQYPKKELENRDVVARALYHEEAHLDLSQCDMDYLEKECKNIAQMDHDFPDQLLMVRPVAHFFMGGIPLRTDCTTELEGLYVCGEVTGGLHGANRLAGSALTECVLFGHIAGRNAAEYAASHEKQPLTNAALAQATADYPKDGTATFATMKQELRQLMWEHVSLVRNLEDLQKTIEKIHEMKQEFSKQNPANRKEWIQMRNLLFTAELITDTALQRTESVGAHYLE